MSTITRIERHLRLTLLPELRALYKRADGDPAWDEDKYGPSDSSGSLPMRLMSSAEVIRVFDRYGGATDLRDSAGFWEGMSGTYAFVYLTGPLQGRVYFWDYDGRHTSVAYRSVRSFLQALQEAGEHREAGEDHIDWNEMPTDYFIESQYYYHGAAECRPASPAELAEDIAAREKLRREYVPENIKDIHDEHHYAFNIIALTPPDRTAELTEFLRSKDMWVQERACEILGNRRYEPAVDQLAQVARSGTPNGRSAAARALQRIGSAAARQRLRELREGR